jgi:trans-2,3-dihydro-3-hydroxyanthranilate isomerase
MRYRFVTLDVFTDRAFGGNPLAVLPDARGLSERQMQRVAREFNYSETAFVLPPADSANTRRVRIFTPAAELPFAGHPTVGTAFALAELGELGERAERIEVVFEEQAGRVPVPVELDDGRPQRATLTAPARPRRGAGVDPAQVAAALALAPGDIAAAPHAPCVAGAPVPFVFAALTNAGALARVRLRGEAAEALLAARGAVGVFAYAQASPRDLADFRARMFAPGHGIAEDPATGAAAAAFAGLHALLDPAPSATRAFTIAQGVEMGRPSLIEAAADKSGGEVTAIRVGGRCVMVSSGEIEVPED